MTGDVAGRAVGALLVPIPLLTIFGNALVVIAVARQRSLQTVTNMLIVSLAVSDFLVAICVMSFAVYLQLNSQVWGLGSFLCNLYMGADVACSTASILNLLAISLDRYIAISHPLAYAQYGSHNGRAFVSLSIVWGVSLAVALPILFGVNQAESHACGEFTNAYFIVISSLLSFFIPCLGMIVLYAVIFKRLRERQRARSMRQGGAHEENDKISNALLGSARMASQMGRHFKHRTDQILLEISYQTSSYPTQSDSSDEAVSTLSPASRRHEVSPPPCTAIERPSSPPPVEEQPSENPSLSCLQTALNHMHTSSSDIRSFGEHLQELFPFIDGTSRRGSDSSYVSGESPDSNRTSPSFASALPSNMPSPQREQSPVPIAYRHIGTLTNGNVPKIHNSYSSLTFNNNSTATMNKNNCKKNSLNLMSTLSPPRNGHVPTIVNPKNSMPAIHRPKPKMSKTVGNDDSTFSDSMRVYKHQLWKRVTGGWQGRPSRQLVKKATKQMRREHKATVTLAVVLAVFLFCWLPFFMLHLGNALRQLLFPIVDKAYFETPLIFATWLGYFNSSLNPLIYTVFDQRFRNAFRQILNMRPK